MKFSFRSPGLLKGSIGLSMALFSVAVLSDNCRFVMASPFFVDTCTGTSGNCGLKTCPGDDICKFFGATACGCGP